MPWISDSQATVELIETRRLIETGIMELAVERATDKEIRQIGKVTDEMSAAADSGNIAKYQESAVEPATVGPCPPDAMLEFYFRTFFP
jgi:DNA-binding FadR family transcriptional regulator